MIYLDNNATTPLHPDVLAAMSACWSAQPLNPASQHRVGRRAQRLLEDAREAIARLLDADPVRDRVIFTSGGTEANNLALFGLAAARAGKTVVSAIEHPSILAAAEELTRRGGATVRLDVSPDGVVCAEHLRDLLDASPTRLVSAMLVNNETGVVQPVAKLAELCRGAGVPLHTDAAQAVGKLPVSFRRLGVAAMTVAAHKLHGPAGVGALIVRGDVPLTPILFGGAQQLELRPGTEPVALAVGMQRALELWREKAEIRRQFLQQQRDRLEALICERIADAVVIGRDAPRAPHTLAIAFPGVDRQAALMALDLAGVACSTGSACASGSSEPSPVLQAMRCEEAIVRSALRFSLGVMNTADEIDAAAARIVRTVQALRR